MKVKVAVIAGDGIGPEITNAALLVMDTVGERFNHTFLYDFVMAGGLSLDLYGVPLTEEELKKCKKSDGVLLAAVGGARWDKLPGNLRPERALLTLRKELGLYANIRPAKLFPPLKDACPLKNVGNFDIVIVRELTGGIYFGESGRREGENGREAFDTETYGEAEIERIAKTAFEVALKRNKNLVSVDKANVLESSRLWREVIHNVAEGYPNVKLSDMLVDNAAMQLIRNPSQFDVIVTSNIFGDILSDEASQLTGSIGLLASASLGKTSLGMYEPIHGSAPDIAGQDKANPIAEILSVAMMFRYSFGMETEADAIERAVEKALNNGYRTADIATDGAVIGTRRMAEIIAGNIA